MKVFYFISIAVVLFLNSCGPKKIQNSYDCQCGQDAWKYIKGHEYGDFYKAWGYPSDKREIENAEGEKQVLYTWRISNLFIDGEYKSNEISIAFDSYISTIHSDPVQDFGEAQYFYCGNAGPFH